MAKRCGNDFYLQVKVASVWQRLDTARSDSGVINNEAVDATAKGDGWRQILDGCGVQAVTLSSQGLVAAPAVALDALELASRTGAIVEARLITNDANPLYEGFYKVTSFERDGEYNDAEGYSVSLESTGTVTGEVIPVFIVDEFDNNIADEFDNLLVE
jgi:predicted secreted protein